MANEQEFLDALAEIGDTTMRLRVLEMTVAAIAARLPQHDFEEIVSMLVFVAKTSDAARDLDEPSSEVPGLTDASHYATEMLERIARSRRAGRGAGHH